MKKLLTFTFILLLPLWVAAQDQVQVKVSGWVNDVNTHIPLVGCHVFMDDHFGTVVDKDGYFEINIPVAQITDPLYFSYVGYETQSMPVSELNTYKLAINMEPSVTLLEEVIVYADPWEEFRAIVEDLSVRYPDKEQFLKALQDELEAIETRLGLQEKQL